MTIITKQAGADRIVRECDVCKGGVDVPNKGMGRAVVAAWETQHQHHELVALHVGDAGSVPTRKDSND